MGRTTFGVMSLVTTKEAAQILGVTPVRVRQLIKEKRLAAEKHGRDHLLQDREVERFKRHGRRSGNCGPSHLKSNWRNPVAWWKGRLSSGAAFGQSAPCLRATALVNCTVSTSARSRRSGYGSFPKRWGLPNMAKNSKTPPAETEAFCRSEINRMLKNSQTKVIMPVVTLGLLNVFLQKGQRVFTDPEVKKAYEIAVKRLKEFLGHDVPRSE